MSRTESSTSSTLSLEEECFTSAQGAHMIFSMATKSHKKLLHSLTVTALMVAAFWRNGLTSWQLFGLKIQTTPRPILRFLHRIDSFGSLFPPPSISRLLYFSCIACSTILRWVFVGIFP
ncbi:hypothetical protein Zmor_007971 [Zophobas morio]|uniref:Transmembrane protein n=1 Tax=Zophobas morio TaxID=2755281 RepID=A0AA38MQ34_9CUCU|nr:hypothetical protein Zmor_007971 [Zophobas morio]